jgi:hypothetical protein
LEAATDIGMSMLEFWEISPKELALAINGYIKRQEIRNKESIYQAYLISRWVWAKKIDIKQILDEKQDEIEPENMLTVVKALNAKFGGRVIE